MADDKKKQPKKSNLWKYLVGCGVLVVVLGIAGIAGVVYWISQSFTQDPVKAKAIASSFIEFDVPEGYQMKFGGKILGIKMAAFAKTAKEDEGLFAMVMYFPKYMAQDRKAMESQMDQQLQKQAGQKNYRVEDRDETTLTVRGEDVKATRATLVEEGSGAEKRQYTFLLDAKDGGTIMVMLQGPEDDFDSAAMDAFIDSIK